MDDVDVVAERVGCIHQVIFDDTFHASFYFLEEICKS
ncbi:predicted protein [Botrytis cinerea T4]|uniref:Uncharacterized protein n=1 Tax=Botryotinia fuckeliana (strain T4) TaxID=999810 RepID=G2YQC8_BOTF4|nr:predicted protein [Botrytis cinerea T4]